MQRRDENSCHHPRPRRPRELVELQREAHSIVDLVWFCPADAAPMRPGRSNATAQVCSNANVRLKQEPIQWNLALECLLAKFRSK